MSIHWGGRGPGHVSRWPQSTGIVAALNLNFLTSTSLDSRITFSRGTNATLVDATGKLTYAPNNLLTNSESFEAASWSKTNAGTGVVPVVTANAATSPSGDTTADRIQLSLGGGSTSGDWSSIYQVLTILNTTNYIYSVWLRSNDSNTYTVLARDDTGSSATSVLWAVTPTWQRFSYIATSSSTSSSGLRLWLRGTLGTSSTADILAWGAQLEAVTYQTTPGAYNSTTPKNLLGYTQEFDNAAWTKSNAFVQTNLLTYSEQFDNAAWAKNAATVTANAAVAPDGATTADKLVEDTSTAVHRVAPATAPTITNGTAYTATVYAKAAERTEIRLIENSTTGAFASFDIANGTVLSTGSGGSGAITSVGNGWYRCELRFTSAGTSGRIDITLSNGGSISYTGTTSFGAFIWGAQLVQGSTAGDYQRTDAAAAAVQYVAPDGSLTADKLVENTTNSTHRAFQGVTTSAITYTATAYIKKGERKWAYIRLDDSTSISRHVWFDLDIGSIGTVETGLTATILPVGNGWYRCCAKINAALAGTSNILFGIATADNTTTYTGDGTSGIFIWGAQLSNSASLDPYVYNPGAAPSSTAYYGPRFDYDPVTLAAKGLLIEEQRTNLVTYSEQFNDAAWSKIRATVDPNVATAPDGTLNADKLVEDTTAANSHSAARILGSPLAAGTYTYTTYIKQAGRRYAQIMLIVDPASTNLRYAVVFDLQTGTVTSTAATATPPTSIANAISDAGNGWYRCSVTVGNPSGLRVDALISTSVSTTASVAGQNTNGDGVSGLFLYGAQLEAGSFATSYIPTVASTVTRSADVALMQGANFSNWYNQNEGTFVAEYSRFQNVQFGVAIETKELGSGSTANRLLVSPSSTADPRFQNNMGGSAVLDTGSTFGVLAANTVVKTAIAYRSADSAATRNGASPATSATAFATQSYTNLQIGQTNNTVYGGVPPFSINGHIRRISYYNTRLANTTLQALTV